MSSIPLPALDIRPPQQPDPLGAFQKLMALKSLGQQQQIQQQTIQTNQQEQQLRQQQIADQQATRAAMKNWDGKDYDALASSVLKNGGSANAATAITQHGLTIKKTVSDIAKQDAETGSKNLETFIGSHKAIGDALEGIEKVPDDQIHQKAIDTITDLAKGGILQPQAAQQLLQGVQTIQDPKALRDQIDVFAKASMGAKAVADQAKTEAETAASTATAEQKRMESEYYKAHGGAPGVPAETVQMNDWLSKNPGKGPADYKRYIATLPINTRYSLENGGGPGGPGAGGGPAQPGQIAQKFGMTQEAFDQAAEKYYTTGQLPPVGRGISGIALNRALMNRSGELHPGASLAGNEAAFAANKASLSKLQTNFDQVSAFESTAGKNLSLFLDKLSAIPDLGVKFANVPMRLIDDKMIGSDNYQAMKAAQQTAASEAAKVLGSANASGVLSDTQKKEAEDILSGNLSYSAAKKVVETLKQDFANRHQSYADQIADIKGRIGGGGGSQSNPSAQSSGKAVSLAAARQLPAMKGKTDEEIKQAIQAAGHQVVP